MSFCLMPKQGSFDQLRQENFDQLDHLTFKMKIVTMSNMLQLTHEEICERNRIVTVILSFLKPYYPNCEILIFGSSANGFGFKNCDLDLLFLPFPEYCNLDFKGNKDNYIPSPHQIRTGEYPKEKLLFMEDAQHLKFIQRIMFSKCNFFKNVFFVPARCPILNIEFVRSSISCDFSASNRLVVYNTELLRLFGALDLRVRPLIIVLRFWAKSLSFIAKSLLSSYAFTLLVIFYLQNIQPPILPSVKNLREIAGYSRVIDGWETAICKDQNRISKTENSTPIDRLLLDFFEFYWNFDFVHNIVSIYHGKPLPVKEVKDSPDERIKTFPVTSFSIQDAFILSNNISRNAKMKTAFKLSMIIAKELILTKNLRFQDLFTYSIYQSKMDALFENTNSPDVVNFSVHLNYELSCKLGVSDNFDPWYRKVCEVVRDVLQYGLLVDCEVVDSVIWKDKDAKEPPKKKRKISDTLQLLMSIQCASNYVILEGRKKVKVPETEGEDDTEVPSLLRKEFKISKELLKETDSSLVFWFMCQCYKYSASQMSDVIVTFSPLDDDVSIFGNKKHYLRSFVERNVKNILEESLPKQASQPSLPNPRKVWLKYKNKKKFGKV